MFGRQPAARIRMSCDLRGDNALYLGGDTTERKMYRAGNTLNNGEAVVAQYMVSNSAVREGGSSGNRNGRDRLIPALGSVGQAQPFKSLSGHAGGTDHDGDRTTPK